MIIPCVLVLKAESSTYQRIQETLDFNMNREAQSEKAAYPTRSEFMPEDEVGSGGYVVRFARNQADLDQILVLRYEVFNLEMKEGLESSHETGLDLDEYDAGCHHLMVLAKNSNKVVGTYRMQTYEMARDYMGFYSSSEFDFDALQTAFLEQSVELGRACVAREHRNGRVLYHLWRGVCRYLGRRSSWSRDSQTIITRKSIRLNIPAVSGRICVTSWIITSAFWKGWTKAALIMPTARAIRGLNMIAHLLLNNSATPSVVSALLQAWMPVTLLRCASKGTGLRATPHGPSRRSAVNWIFC